MSDEIRILDVEEGKREHAGNVPRTVKALAAVLARLPDGELWTTARLKGEYSFLSYALFSRYSAHPYLEPYRYNSGIGLTNLWGNEKTVAIKKEQDNDKSKSSVVPSAVV